ncbi:MAG TPA: signal peptidase II [Candidatus Acidoferrum sp.]|nr:signal peptidase II [Candidatus Angelobacter sp.]HXD80954.1 signal peptidase II [Candidatus Acidoferrum sp.]
MAFGLVALVVFVLDAVTKSLVAASVPFGTEVPVVGRYVGITNVRNSGAAFGLVPAGAGVFLVASIVVAVALVVYVARTPTSLWGGVVLGLILGGTVGNGFDRLVFGTVTDFINVHFWPVFNVADSAISIGVVLLIAVNVLKRPTA